MKSQVTVVVVALGLGACGSEVGGPPALSPNLGIVAWDDPPTAVVASAELEPGSGWTEESWGLRPPLAVPSSVQRGVPFVATVTTALPDGCWTAGKVSTDVDGGTATITVYDHRSDSEICALIFSWSTREVILQFDEEGDALVRLIGRRVAGEDLGGGEEFVLDEAVLVH